MEHHNTEENKHPQEEVHAFREEINGEGTRFRILFFFPSGGGGIVRLASSSAAPSLSTEPRSTAVGVHRMKHKVRIQPEEAAKAEGELSSIFPLKPSTILLFFLLICNANRKK